MIPKSGVGFSLEIMFKRMENPTAPEPLLVSSPGAVSTRRQGRKSARVGFIALSLRPVPR